jgi:hypothetical protein
MFLKLFQSIERKKILPNSSCQARITVIPKPDKNIINKGNYKPISPIDIKEKLSNNMSKPNPNITSKRSCTMTKWDSFQEHKDDSTYANK